MITGPQGSLVLAHDIRTDIPDYFDGATSYYRDELDAPVRICQECEEAPTAVCPDVIVISDQHLLGAHGPYGVDPIPSTDPRHDEFFHLSGHSVHFYAGPGLTIADAQVLAVQASSPLVYAASPFADVDDDGVHDSDDNCPHIHNPEQTNTPLGPIDNGPSIPGDDVTNPSEDVVGDACDQDADNDGWLDADETGHANCPAATGPGDPLDPDSDGDWVPDGAECLLGSDPNNPRSGPERCNGTDDDGDFEADEGCPDSDSDGLGAAQEGLVGTSDFDRDGDDDGINDCKEIASIDVDSDATILDVQHVAKMAFGLIQPHPGLDIDRDGAGTVLDVQLVAKAALVLGFCPA